MTSDDEAADSFEAAAVEVATGPPPAPEPAAAAPPPAAPATTPWAARGHQYPSFIDFENDEGAQSINEWLDGVTDTDGLARKCRVGPCIMATLVHYNTKVDVHPLIPLAVSGGCFGIGVGVSLWRSKSKSRGTKAAQREAADDLALKLAAARAEN